MDHASVRRLRHRRGDQRALPLPALPRAGRPVDRLRHAQPDGPRLRPPALGGRGGPRGGGHRHPRRHGDAVPRHPAGRRDHVDDHQRPRGGDAGLLRGGRRAPGRRARAPGRHHPDGHPQGVHRAEGVVLPDRPRHAPGHGHGRVLLAEDAALAPGLDLRLPHPRGGVDGAAGAGIHAQGRVHLRGGRPSSAGSTWTTSPPGSASSSTPTSTSSRRSPSTGPRAGSGPGSCATPTARAPSARCSCAATRRPPESH